MGRLWMRVWAALALCCACVSATVAEAAEPIIRLQIELTDPHVSRRGTPPSGATLVANSLSESERQRLAVALQALSDRLAARRNPFFVALDDSDAYATSQALLRDIGPLFTAASALAAGEWLSAEGSMVRPVARCSADSHDRHCVAVLGAPPTSALAQRAHFLAWPLGYAVLLRASSVVGATAMAERLRDGSLPVHAALVLDAADLHRLRPSRSLRAVVRLAAAIVRSQPDLAFAGLLRNIASTQKADDELPWLRLPRNTVLVVPRLGSLATPDQFVAEVRARLGTTPAQWLAWPR